jgi:hypothetical protein
VFSVFLLSGGPKSDEVRNSLWPRLGRALLLGACLVLGGRAQGAPATNFFTGNITLDGDISDFFAAGTTDLLAGVWMQVDPNGVAPGREGLEEPPLDPLTVEGAAFHVSGFNQRRILAAYNPNLNGGSIFVGIDLPGGTGSPANPNFTGLLGPTRVGPDGATAIRPFDADGNGDPESIGQGGATVLRRVSDAGVSLATVDVIDSGSPLVTGFTDSVDPTADRGNRERYQVTVAFGDGTQALVELFEDNRTPPGRAGLSVVSIPAGRPFGAVASRDGSSNVLGFDVEFAITNVNDSVDPCARLLQTISVNSGSLQDGVRNGEDSNQLLCEYANAEAPNVELVGAPRFNRQTGLFEQRVRVSNISTSTFPALRVQFRNLPEGVQVYSVSDTNNGVPLVQYNLPLAPCAQVELTIEYYVSSSNAPTADLLVEAGLPAPALRVTGSSVPITRQQRLPDGNVLLEFNTARQRIYFVQYSTNRMEWKTSLPPIKGTGGRVQWIDNGPPKTETRPATQTPRHYRVIRLGSS